MMDKAIKQRFVKDYNLPINIFDDELFNYYMELYDFFPRDRWDELCRTINEEYGGNYNAWLDYCAKVRDNAIFGVMESEEYKKFNDSKNLLTEYNCDINVGEHSLYSEETDFKYFVSIDLKKANFQALKFAGVLNDETYEDFMKKYGADDYIINSKYLRQVIFGKMNPGRTVKVEKHIMCLIYKMVSEMFPDWKLFSLNSDELVFSMPSRKIDEHKTQWINLPGRDDLKSIETAVKDKLNIDVRVELVFIDRLPIVNYHGNKVDAFNRRNVFTGETTLKKASTTFFPQIYKLSKGIDGLDIEERDLMFYFEDQICKFLHPLKLTTK